MNSHFGNIWIIDDNEIDTFILETFLRKLIFGAKIHCANHGGEAIEWLENKDKPYPDLIFLDINMPVMGGLRFLQEWTARGHTGDSSIVMISSSFLATDKQSALMFADVVDFIEKPPSEQRLNDILQQLREPDSQLQF